MAAAEELAGHFLCVIWQVTAMWRQLFRKLSGQAASDEPSSSSPAGRDGRIAVTAEGIVVSDPKPGGRLAVVQPGPGVIVRLNGSVLEQPTPSRLQTGWSGS